MPDLDFRVHGVEVARHAASPLLLLKLRVSHAGTEAIQNVVLQCQVQIDTARRIYQPGEQKRLVDLFAEPERWGTTLRTMMWTHTSALLPPFEDSCEVDLPLPCSYDFNITATKYFDALEEGEVPLTLLFSGSIFYRAEDGALQVGQISWNKEASFRLPVKVWREMMEHYYPNSAWLCLRKDLFDRLSEYKTRSGMPSWDRTFETLLGSSANQ